MLPKTSPYPPAFIEEMKQRLLADQASIEKELAPHARRSHGDYQATYPDYGRDEEENATEIADFANVSAVTEAEEARLKSIKAALTRIEAGTYGLTDAGEVIPEERLRANPAATTLVTPEQT